MPDWHALFGDASAATVAIWIAAVALVIGVVIKLWPFLSNTVAIVNALLSLPEMSAQVARLTALPEQVTEIHHETHKNDGSSIKDAVDRIEVSLEAVHGRLGAVEASVITLTREDEAIWAEIESTHPPEEEE